MNPFKRKKQQEEDFDEMIIQLPIAEKEEAKPLSPYVLTPDEILSHDDSAKQKSKLTPLEELKNRMQTLSEQKNTKEQEEEEESFTPFFNINLDAFESDDEHQPIEEQTKEETEDEQLQLAFLDGITGRYPEKDEEDEVEEAISDNTDISLYQTCMPFITEGNNGELPKTEPIYTLERVESILGLEIPEEDEKPKKSESVDHTIVFEAIKTNTADISDIDSIPKPIINDTVEEISFTRTMPVIITPDGLEESREIDISSEIFSKKEESHSLVDMPLADEDADFVAEPEFKTKADAKKVRIFLLKDRRNRFLSLVLSIFVLIVLAVISLPTFKDSMQSVSIGITVISFVCTALSVVACFDTFKSLSTLFTKRTESDVLFCFTLLSQLIGMVVAVANNLESSVCYYFALLLAINTFFRSLFLFKKSAYIYNNFRLVSNPHSKQGMVLIDDAPTTFAMAHRAIDGDVLIAAPQKTNFINNFMKNSTVDRDLDSKVKPIFIFSAVICLLCGLAVGIYHQSAISGVISFAYLSALFTPLILFGVSTLPLSSASKKLGHYKAAVFGVKCARKIEEANAVAIDCDTLFPKGSIKLNNLKILCENNLEETIAIAAAITETIGSPLFPIFKSAMDTNESLSIPQADSIKYEDRLGITGWVGDSRVFIGNRALMLAHEIDVPDMQIDKKLLTEGFFPVYLARDGKACALLAVRYIPNEYITKELKRITNMGITVLINNCDQNLSEEMLCDYFDLYSDSVKIMSGSGVHMYKNATSDTDALDCGAVLSGKATAVCGIVSCCVKIKRAVALLTVACVLSIVIGVVLFAYKYFGTAALFISGFDLVIYQLVSLASTLIAYLFTKP